MTTIENLCLFLGITKKTWYNWKKEQRPITKFIEKYLSAEDINEFLKNNGEISKLNLMNSIMPIFNNDFLEFYHQEFRDNFNPFEKKFFNDFTYRFKNQIQKISNKDNIQYEFNLLLCEYQIILLEISKVIKYPQIEIISHFQSFYSDMNIIDKFSMYFLINSIKHDFSDLDSHKKRGSLFNDERENPFSLSSFTYNTKNDILIPIDTLRHINKYVTDSKKKDFFEVYQEYIENIEPF